MIGTVTKKVINTFLIKVLHANVKIPDKVKAVANPANIMLMGIRPSAMLVPDSTLTSNMINTTAKEKNNTPAVMPALDLFIFPLIPSPDINKQ